MNPWETDQTPQPRRFGPGCLIALIVTAIGIAVAAVLVAKALAAALSGVSV